MGRLDKLVCVWTKKKKKEEEFCVRSLLENESGEKIRIILQEEKFLSQREEKKISHMICLLGRKMSGCKMSDTREKFIPFEIFNICLNWVLLL